MRVRSDGHLVAQRAIAFAKCNYNNDHPAEEESLVPMLALTI